jgi:hypothetical protein
MWVYVHNVTNFIKRSRSKNTSAQTLQQQTDSAKEGGTTEDSLQDLTNWGRHTDQCL